MGRPCLGPNKTLRRRRRRRRKKRMVRPEEGREGERLRKRER